MDLTDIRNEFPFWPSELEIAKSSFSWEMLAIEFMSAGEVLIEESEKSIASLSQLNPIDSNAIKRSSTSIPTLFCIAFAFELAAKAAFIKQKPGELLNHNDCLKIGNHSISKIIDQLDGIFPSDSERKWISAVEDIVINGKYPTSKNPSKEKSGIFNKPNASELHKHIKPLFDKIIKLIES